MKMALFQVYICANTCHNKNHYSIQKQTHQEN